MTELAGTSRQSWRVAVLSLVAVLLCTVPVAAQEPAPHRAGLVVVYGDGTVVTRCVGFAEDSISGVDLIRRSGLPVVLDAYGGLGYGVCAIGGVGCAAGQDCFCQCRGNPCAYWIYSHRQADGAWVASGLGASAWQLHDGDVDGWVWGDGTVSPPPVSFEEACASPLAATGAGESPPPAANPVSPAAEAPAPSPVPTLSGPTPTPIPLQASPPRPVAPASRSQSSLAPSPVPASPTPTVLPPSAVAPSPSPAVPASSGTSRMGTYLFAAIAGLLLLWLAFGLLRQR